MTTETIFKSPAGEKAVMDLYDEVLAHWPVEKQTLTVPTRHGDTFVIAGGDPAAPPLILLHGASSNSTAWAGDFAPYSRHFRVYAVDIPGDPGKSAQKRLPWDGPAYADWLEDVLDGLKIEKTHLLGLSQGGWMALRFATAHPERVEKLVLLTPGGVAPTRTSFILKAMGYSMLGKWGTNRLNRYVFSGQPIHPDALRFMDVIMANQKPAIDREYLFTDEELRRLDMPVLLLGGDHDVIRPNDAIIARLRGLLPRLQAELIPNMGHVLVNMTDRVLPFLLEK